ncbi:MAG: alpha/beta hydrolase family protein, partial [Pirellula sp.]
NVATVTGAIISPDQSSEEISLTDLQLEPTEPDGWRFQLVNPKDAKPIASFRGTQVSADRVEGKLDQSGQSLSANFERINQLPAESAQTLGADAVWTGTLNLVVKKLDFRIRAYSQPPFATKDSPRVLFDSLSERFVGIPATVQMDQDRNTTFEIAAIGAKFSAKLNEAGNELVGSFTQNKIPFPLSMRLVEPASNSQASTPTVPQETAPTTAESTKPSTAIPPQGLERKSIETDTYLEVPFEVVLGNANPSKKQESANASDVAAKEKIAGTITLPKTAKAGGKAFPAVVMVTGSGPQDRDETIGRHKPFAVLAHFLAEQGIASLRYDDRGVGESTGNFLTATSADFAKDALAVWNYACGLKELDSERIGILGHSEGGMVGPMVANWESKVAFLILLAPPGVTGGDVLKSQIDRMSELQGVDPATRRATMMLQQQLQDIAAGYFVDDATMKRDIRQAIQEQWPSLESAALAMDPMVNTTELKQQLTSQIDQQFMELKSPWYAYFLNYDPGPSWLLLRCPTLAIWGEKDTQVLPQLNGLAIEQMVERNPALEATLVVLPSINHMMQNSKT